MIRVRPTENSLCSLFFPLWFLYIMGRRGRFNGPPPKEPPRFPKRKIAVTAVIVHLIATLSFPIARCLTLTLSLPGAMTTEHRQQRRPREIWANNNRGRLRRQRRFPLLELAWLGPFFLSFLRLALLKRWVKCQMSTEMHLLFVPPPVSGKETVSQDPCAQKGQPHDPAARVRSPQPFIVISTRVCQSRFCFFFFLSIFVARKSIAHDSLTPPVSWFLSISQKTRNRNCQMTYPIGQMESGQFLRMHLRFRSQFPPVFWCCIYGIMRGEANEFVIISSPKLAALRKLPRHNYLRRLWRGNRKTRAFRRQGRGKLLWSGRLPGLTRPCCWFACDIAKTKKKRNETLEKRGKKNKELRHARMIKRIKGLRGEDEVKEERKRRCRSRGFAASGSNKTAGGSSTRDDGRAQTEWNAPNQLLLLIVTSSWRFSSSIFFTFSY